MFGHSKQELSGDELSQFGARQSGPDGDSRSDMDGYSDIDGDLQIIIADSGHENGNGSENRDIEAQEAELRRIDGSDSDADNGLSYIFSPNLWDDACLQQITCVSLLLAGLYGAVAAYSSIPSFGGPESTYKNYYNYDGDVLVDTSDVGALALNALLRFYYLWVALTIFNKMTRGWPDFLNTFITIFVSVSDVALMLGTSEFTDDHDPARIYSTAATMLGLLSLLNFVNVRGVYVNDFRARYFPETNRQLAELRSLDAYLGTVAIEEQINETFQLLGGVVARNNDEENILQHKLNYIRDRFEGDTSAVAVSKYCVDQNLRGDNPKTLMQRVGSGVNNVTTVFGKYVYARIGALAANSELYAFLLDRDNVFKKGWQHYVVTALPVLPAHYAKNIFYANAVENHIKLILDLPWIFQKNQRIWQQREQHYALSCVYMMAEVVAVLGIPLDLLSGVGFWGAMAQLLKFFVPGWVEKNGVGFQTTIATFGFMGTIANSNGYLKLWQFFFDWLTKKIDRHEMNALMLHSHSPSVQQIIRQAIERIEQETMPNGQALAFYGKQLVECWSRQVAVDNGVHVPLRADDARRHYGSFNGPTYFRAARDQHSAARLESEQHNAVRLEPEQHSAPPQGQR